MLMLLDNLICLVVLFFAFTFIFKLFLNDNRLLSKTICIFLLLHVIFVAVILIEQHRFKINLANSIFMDDGETYSANGWQIATALTNTIPDIASIARMRGIHLTDRGWGLERYYSDYVKKKIIPPASEYEVGYISYLYSIIYAAYGFKPVFINFMNVMLHLFTAILIYKSVVLIFDDRAAYLTALFFLLNPISFYYSSTKLQEAAFAFVVYLSIYCFLMTIKKRNYWYALFMFPSFYIIHSLLKTHYFIPILLAFVTSSMIILFKKNKKVFFILTVLIIFSLTSMRTSMLGEIKFHTMKSLNNSIIYQKGFYNTGGQVYQLFIPGKDSQDYTLLDWASHILRGWYHILSEPILSSNTSAKLILFFPIKIVFLILCALAVPGILMAMRYGHIEAVIFLSILIMVGTGLAISSGNVGTMLRHREIITPIIFIFSSFYITRLYHISDFNDMRKG